MRMAAFHPFWLTSLLFFSYSFLTLSQPLYNNCSTTSNYTANSTYETNLNRLLSSFPYNAYLTGFYNATAGDWPNKIYGFVLCRNDITPATCRDCVNAGTEDIQQLCPYNKAATVWYDYCFLRYSNLNFFSIVAGSNWVYLYNSQNVTDPLSFNNVVKDMLNRLATHAAYESLQMFATGEVNFKVSRSMKVYGLVQCSRDVSRRDCKQCLDVAISQLESCCDGREGGRVVGTSCNFRYELYSFYNGSTLGTLPSSTLPPLISHIPPPQPPAGESNKGDSGKRKWLVPVVIISILMAFLVLGTFVYLCKKRGNKHETLLDEDGNNNNADIAFYDFASIMVATDRFSDSNKLGQGGFGAVYKGKLSQGQEIAVKRLSKSSGQGAEEFKNEVILIAKLQHRNLVRLLGYCISRDEKMLLYEYMPNRSLDFFLFDKTRCEFLDWTRRFVIILGIARGLLYLHQDSRLRIIHRDLKTSNILLDEEMNPKISDFGLARIFEGNQTEESTNRVVGTYGYMSPEYASHGLFSVKSDVFSFGVILIEIITGRKNTSFVHSEDFLTLLGHAWQLWKEGKGMDLMDPSMTETCDKQEVLKCLQVGLLCVEEDATDRPTMATVITLLTSETAMLPTPRKPALFVRSHSKNVSPQNNARNCSNNEVTMSCLEGR